MSSNELIHHGVKGMKWGVRRSQATLDRLAGRVSELERARKINRQTRGASSNEFRKSAKNLYIARSKYKIAKAKNEHNQDDLTIAKAELAEAKMFKKRGTSGYDNNYLKKVFGSTLSKNEMTAIAVNEYATYSRKEKGKQALRTAVGTLGTIGLVAAGIAAEVHRRNF